MKISQKYVEKNSSFIKIGQKYVEKNSSFIKISQKFVEKIQVSLKSAKNNGQFTWLPIHILDHISHGTSYNEKYLRQNL